MKKQLLGYLAGCAFGWWSVVCVNPSHAADLIVPDKVDYGTLVRISFEVQSGDEVHWFLNTSHDFIDKISGNEAEMAFAAGCKYAIVTGDVTVINWDTRKYERQRFEVEIGEKPNGPEPDPDPDPEPPPGKRKVVVLYESEDVQNYGPTFGSACQETQEYCLSKGHIYYRLDDDSVNPDGQQPAWLLEYLDMLRNEGISLPGMIVVAEWEGKEYATPNEFPKTGEEAIKIIQELGG